MIKVFIYLILLTLLQKSCGLDSKDLKSESIEEAAETISKEEEIKQKTSSEEEKNQKEKLTEKRISGLNNGKLLVERTWAGFQSQLLLGDSRRYCNDNCLFNVVYHKVKAEDEQYRTKCGMDLGHIFFQIASGIDILFSKLKVSSIYL